MFFILFWFYLIDVKHSQLVAHTLAANFLIDLLKSSLANYSWLHRPDGCQALFLINLKINQIQNINFDVSYEEII